MSEGEIYEIARQGLMLVILLSLPMLAIAALASLLSALLQSVVKVSEPMVSHLPRIVSVFVVILVAGPWISSRISEFANRLWSAIAVIRP